MRGSVHRLGAALCILPVASLPSGAMRSAARCRSRSKNPAPDGRQRRRPSTNFVRRSRSATSGPVTRLARFGLSGSARRSSRVVSGIFKNPPLADRDGLARRRRLDDGRGQVSAPGWSGLGRRCRGVVRIGQVDLSVCASRNISALSRDNGEMAGSFPATRRLRATRRAQTCTATGLCTSARARHWNGAGRT